MGLDMKRIGLMGGTFDPVHFGHLSIALAAQREIDLDKVILMPAYIQPFKRDKFVTDDELRLEMLNLSILDKDGIEISTWELDKKGISYTYDTISHLKNEMPEDEIWFIMGSDSLMKIESWHKGVELLESCFFLVGARPEDPIDTIIEQIDYLTDKYQTRIHLLNEKMLPISSTLVREKIERDEPISGLVPPMVEDYIYAKRLYGRMEEENPGDAFA